MNKEKITSIFSILKAKNPKPTTELIYNSNFELLISVILSAQATDVSVNKATKELYKTANTPETILALGYEGLVNYIKSIGLYKTKAKNVLNTCEALINTHGSKVPNTRKELEALAGVGRKTANVILNTAFGQPTIAVDTHIFRVSNRINLAKGKTVDEVEKKLLRKIPAEYKLDAHHWLILHGRYTCIARKPKCNDCNITHLCEYKAKEL
jgi:endonuclease-3